MASIMNAVAFAEEAATLLDELEFVLEDLREDGTDVELLAIAQRVLHTLYGAGRLFGFTDLAGMAAGLEPLFLDALRDARAVPEAELDVVLQACGRMRGALSPGSGAAGDSARSGVATGGLCD